MVVIGCGAVLAVGLALGGAAERVALGAVAGLACHRGSSCGRLVCLTPAISLPAGGRCKGVYSEKVIRAVGLKPVGRISFSRPLRRADQR